MGDLAARLKAYDEQFAALRDLKRERPNLPIGEVDASLLKSPVIPTFFGSALVGLGSFPLRPGMAADEVGRLQEKLKQLSCYSNEATGTFDKRTELALVAFREAEDRAWANTLASFSSLSSVHPSSKRGLDPMLGRISVEREEYQSILLSNIRCK